MKVSEINAKSILSKSQVYEYALNPYVGCRHECVYCYARFMKRFTGHKEKWGAFVDVKINAPELLSHEVKRKKTGRVRHHYAKGLRHWQLSTPMESELLP